MRSTPVNQRQAGTTNSLSAPIAPSPINIVESVGLYQPPLVITVYGKPGAGKSHLAGSAPGDIGLIPLERKSLETVSKACIANGKKLYRPDVDLIRTARPMLIDSMDPACVTADPAKNVSAANAATIMQRMSKEMKLENAVPLCCQQHYYRWHANRTKAACFKLAEMPNIRTVMIDTFGQLVEDLLYANYGRVDSIMPLDRKSFNQEVRDFLNCMGMKHLILTHQSAGIWVDNKPTGREKPMSSFNRIGHYTSIELEFKRKDERVDGQVMPKYECWVRDCQANPSLIGTTVPLFENEDISFPNIAAMVYPEIDPETWYD